MDWKPHILEWLQDVRKVAETQAAKPNGSRYKLTAVDRAINSIEHNIDSVSDPKELSALPRVGDKTITLLSNKIKKYCSQNPGTPLPPSLASQATAGREGSGGGTSAAPKVLADRVSNQSYPFAPPPAPKRREYIPKYGSAPYHVLLSMRLNEIDDPTSQGIGQSELQRLMKPRTAGVLEGAMSRSTPAVGMALKTLKEHDLVYVQNSRYFLDEVGRELATKLLHASGDAALVQKARSASVAPMAARTTSSMLQAEAETSGHDSTVPSYVTDEWPPGSFITKLLIDNREVASRNDRTGLVNDLRNLGLDLDVQALSLGDCVWVAEHKKSGRRAVLDWIIERKTLGDLRSSIHDGRYHDQKKRLAKSTVPHIVYLVEFANNVANNEMFKDNRKKFLTAMSQTLVRHHFHLKLTRSQNETVQYIGKLTELLQQRYTAKPLKVVVPNIHEFEASMALARAELVPNEVAIDYSAFHEALAKSKMQTIGETFRLMLRTIKGISAEKAAAIQRVYPTPTHLRKAYMQEPNDAERKAMIHKATKHCVRRQQLRAGLSEAIYEAWGPD